MGIFIYTMQHTIMQRVLRREYTAHSRNGERRAKSFRKHELLKSLGTINPGPTGRGETFHNQDSPLTEGKVSVIGQKIFPCETWRPGSRAAKGKSAEIKELSLTLSF